MDSSLDHFLKSCARVLAGAGIAFVAAGSASATDCPQDRVAAGGGCVSVEQAVEGIRAIVREEMAAMDLKAVIVKVSIGNRLLVEEAWGESMTGVPATTEMHFRNGAVAIAYMSTVLLQLQEKGVLSLDDALSNWFPQFPEADRITLRMLINSTSGYADYVNLDLLPLHADPFRQWTPDELIAIGLGQPMKCAPGTCFAYAHTNFVILGEVFSRVTGSPVEELIRDGVLTPLGLHNTRSELTPAIQPPVLHAFDGERGLYEESTFWNPSWTLARGAVMTTNIADLHRSAIAIGEGSLLSAQSRALQVARPTIEPDPFPAGFHYGLGVVVTNDWVVQTPSFAGYAAAMAYLPERRIAIAVTATMGPKTPDTPRSTDVLFTRFGHYLAPDRAPILAR